MVYEGYPQLCQEMQDLQLQESLRWPGMHGQWSKFHDDNVLKWMQTWKMAHSDWSPLWKTKDATDGRTIVFANLPFELTDHFWHHHLPTIEKRNDNGQWELAGVRVESMEKGGPTQDGGHNDSKWYKVVLAAEVMVDAVILALHGRIWNLFPLPGPFAKIKVIPWSMWELDMHLDGCGPPPWNHWGPYATVSPAIVWESWHILQATCCNSPRWGDREGGWSSFYDMVMNNGMDSLPYSGGYLCGPRQLEHPMTAEAIGKCFSLPPQATTALPAIAPPVKPLPPSGPPKPTGPVSREPSPERMGPLLFPPDEERQPKHPLARSVGQFQGPLASSEGRPGGSLAISEEQPEGQSAAQRAAARKAMRQQLLANAEAMWLELTQLQGLISSIIGGQASGAAWTRGVVQASGMSSGTSNAAVVPSSAQAVGAQSDDAAPAAPAAGAPEPEWEAASGATETGGVMQAKGMSSGTSDAAAAVPSIAQAAGAQLGNAAPDTPAAGAPEPEREAASGATETSWEVQATGMSSGTSDAAAAVPSSAQAVRAVASSSSSSSSSSDSGSFIHAAGTGAAVKVPPAWPPPEREENYWSHYRDTDLGLCWSSYRGPLGEWFADHDGSVYEYFEDGWSGGGTGGFP